MDAPLTPKIQNKRRSPSCSTSIGVSAIGGDTFDCQTLQRCLKKVRLTTNITPGELRLQRDLRHAVLSRQWFPVQDECEWIIPYQPPLVSSVSSPRSEPSVFPRRCREESQDDCMFQDVSIDDSMNDNDMYNTCAPSLFLDPNQVSVKVTRDEQDPMELVVRIDVTTYHPIAWSDASTSTVTGQTLHLQFPRMYPHRPPVVRRIEHHRGVPTTTHHPAPTSLAHRWTAGNLTHSNWNSSSSSTSENPGRTMGSRDYIPTDEDEHGGGTMSASSLQRIVIAASPDCAAEIQAATCTPGTIILTEWSPVSRLTDICEWLIQAVVSWHLQGTRRHPVSDLDALSTTVLGRSGDSSPSTPTTTNRSVTLRHRISGEEKKDTEDGPFWGDGDSSFHPIHLTWNGSPTDRSMSPEQQDLAAISSSDFLPNGRFDVGYDRQIPLPDEFDMDCQDDDYSDRET